MFGEPRCLAGALSTSSSRTGPVVRLTTRPTGDVLTTPRPPVVVAALLGPMAVRFLMPRLARASPRAQDPACVVGASVIEPAAMAKGAKWEYQASNAGFGTFEDMIAMVHELIGEGPFILGEQFTMADVIFGATVRYMTSFKMMEADAIVTFYLERINARPANARAEAINAKIIADKGLGG